MLSVVLGYSIVIRTQAPAGAEQVPAVRKVNMLSPAAPAAAQPVEPWVKSPLKAMLGWRQGGDGGDRGDRDRSRVDGLAGTAVGDKRRVDREDQG